MHKVLILLFLSVFSVDYLTAHTDFFSRYLSLVPELLSGIAVILVAGRLAQSRRFDLSPKYLVFFLLYGIHLVAGILVNDGGPGAVAGATRVYMKYLPFFFAPAVFNFTPAQVRVQLLCLTALLLFQLPVAVLQRVIYAGATTGDVVRGTLETGSIMSIILVSGIAMLLGMFLKGVISRKQFGWLFVLFLLPTTINETKGTLFLLPIALVIPYWIAGRLNARALGAMMGLGGIAFVLFAGLYSYTQTTYNEGKNASIIAFLTDPHWIMHYVAPQMMGVNTDRQGRLDQPIEAIERLSEDPILLLTGYGAGSVTRAPIDALEGERVELYNDGLVTTVGPYMIYETGLLGVAFWAWFFVMVFRDARRLGSEPGLPGALGLGWAAVVLILVASILYKHWVNVNAIMYPFWYLTGLMLALNVRLRIRDARRAGAVYGLRPVTPAVR